MKQLFARVLVAMRGAGAEIATPAKPTSVVYDWMLPASEPRKREILGKEWGTQVTGYLWYELGDTNNLREHEIDAIAKAFFVDGEPGFGDIELHQARGIPGRPLVLRIRGYGKKVRLLPAFTLRGRYCALYMVGRGDDKDRVNFYEAFGGV